MLVDAHAHLDMYGPDLPRALEILRRRRILTVSVSMDLSSWKATRAIAATEPLVLPAFGIHPWNAARWVGPLDTLDPHAAEATLLGEVGLDHFFRKDAGEYPAQRVLFEYFLDAARRLEKPLSIHSKGAEPEVARLLEEHGACRAILHWYSGPLKLVERFLALGCSFSVGVELLRSKHIRKVARRIPLDRLLTETDNPGAWEWMTGEKGLPDQLDAVLDRLAELKEVERAELERAVASNLHALLGPRVPAAGHHPSPGDGS